MPRTECPILTCKDILEFDEESSFYHLMGHKQMDLITGIILLVGDLRKLRNPMKK